MTDWLMEFEDRYLYGVLEKLAVQRDALAQECREVPVDDQATRDRLTRKLGRVLSFLGPPFEPTPASERLRIGLDLLRCGDLSTEDFLPFVRSTGRPVGRVSTAGYDGALAYELHLKTAMTWREIALEIKGPCSHRCSQCNDVERPPDHGRKGQRRVRKAVCDKCKRTIRTESTKQQVCYRCVDAVRSSAGEVAIYLDEIGLLPISPRRIVADKR